jgi:hypothetical protein
MNNGDSATEQEAALHSCLRQVESILDQLGVDWTIAGAFAAAEYRDSHRHTTDGDFLTSWHPDLPTALEAVGFEVRVVLDGDEPHLIRARRTDGTGAVDLILAGTEYQHLAIERGSRSVLTIEDVFVHKLIAWRPKDRDDIRSILGTSPTFDTAYVDHWAEEWDVTDRWREAQSWR